MEWYEYFYVVSIVVAFSHFMDNTFTPKLKALGARMTGLIKGDAEEEDVGKIAQSSVFTSIHDHYQLIQFFLQCFCQILVRLCVGSLKR